MDKGAHFYNCDFQVHTPRDQRWSWAGKDSLGINGCVSDHDRKAYAESLIIACRRKKLDAIAITDHHDMAFFKHVKEAAAIECDQDGNIKPSEKQIVVFPGMEITINPCQLLLIFDADFNEDDFQFIYTLLNISPAIASAPKTANKDRLPIDDVDKLRAKLDENDTLRDKFIILPNLGKDS